MKSKTIQQLTEDINQYRDQILKKEKVISEKDYQIQELTQRHLQEKGKLEEQLLELENKKETV